MKVGLYIYTESLENTSNVTANDFKARVLNDSGNFEALQCCIDNIESLGGTSAIVPTAKRIDLFNDETIQVTSSLQNVNDIKKVFTDYSQSFTVPASANNNAIFKHWYDGQQELGFDQRKRYDGYIELDSELFRVGRWQIESAEVKDNEPTNYKLTFYGVLRSLQDQFGEDKLRDLPFLDTLTFEFTGNNVRNRIRFENDVVFPLISSKRVWQYGGGGQQDISNNAHAIDITELFPAVRVAKIFEAIETKYGVNFSGQLLNQSRFTKLFMWFKNSEVLNVGSSVEDVDITSVTNPSGRRWTANTTTNAIANDGFISLTQFLKLFVTVTVPAGVTWTLSIFRNGVPFGEVTETDSVTDYLLLEQTSIFQNATLVGFYTFKIQTSTPTTATLLFEGETKQSGLTVITTIANATATTTGNITLTNLAPDMKVADFFSGILKMFNLTCLSFDETNYRLEQLENWYLQGQIKDITDYTITELEVERFKVFKNIIFKYQQSQSFVNRNFADTFKREYGDTSEKFTNDGSDYTIDLPFEKLQYVRLGGGTLNVAFSLQAPDFRPYIPKPVLFYVWKNQPTSKFYVKGSSAVALNDYLVTGDFTEFNLDFHSNNWGQEQSVQTGLQLTNSLFSNYYSNYIANLYKLQSRVVKCKAILPTIDLINLKLNDRLIIRGVRYLINQFTTNLTNGEVDFELIKDFRETQPSINQTVVFPADGGTVKIPVLDPDETFTIINDPDDIIRVITPIPTDPSLEIIIADNPGATPLEGTIGGSNGSIISIILQP